MIRPATDSLKRIKISSDNIDAVEIFISASNEVTGTEPTMNKSLSDKNHVGAGLLLAEAIAKEEIEAGRTASATPAKKSLVAAIKDLPTVVWWNEDDKHPVFNNANGEDLILRKDVLATLSQHTANLASELPESTSSDDFADDGDLSDEQIDTHNRIVNRLALLEHGRTINVEEFAADVRAMLATSKKTGK